MEQSCIKREEYQAVDIAKFVMAFFVIAIHTHYNFFDNVIANTFITHFLIRLAVPFFFVASSFFFFRGIVFEKGKIKKSPENRAKLFSFLKRTGVLYSIWAVIYFVWVFFKGCISGTFSFVNIKVFVFNFVFNGFATQFWYLLYLIYSVVIFYVLLRFVNYKIVAIVPLVFLMVLVYQRIYYHILPIEPLYNICNRLIQISIGGETIVFGTSLYNAMAAVYGGIFAVKLKQKLNRGQCIVWCIISTAVLLAECYFVKSQAPELIIAILIFSVPMVMFLFLLLSNIKISGNKKFFSFLRNSSSFVYCFHYLPLMVFNYFTGNSFVKTVALLIVVSVISLAASCIVLPLSNKLRFLKKLY